MGWLDYTVKFKLVTTIFYKNRRFYKKTENKLPFLTLRPHPFKA
jgi:hypothetical protein